LFRNSLVSRLIWHLGSAMAGLWLFGSISTGLLTVFEMNERLDNALEEVAQRLLPSTYKVETQPVATQKLARQLVASMDPKALAYQILDPSGAIIMGSENAPAKAFVFPWHPGFRDITNYRVYTQPALVKGYYIEVAEPKMHRDQALRRAIALSVGPLLLLLPLAWFMIRWAVFRSMRSLIRLQREISRRDGSHLARIPDLGMPVELVPILNAVNHLLERLENALSSERQFAANSAHELRTPIAAVLAQMQLLAAQLAGTAQAERATRIVGQIKRLGSLAEKLLQLSRAGAGFALHHECIDVIAVLQLLADEFRRLDQVGARLRMTVRPAADFSVRAELDLLGIAFRNLIENAVLYGAPHEPIDIIVEHDRSVRIVSGGQAVPAETLTLLKKPFVRGTAVGVGGGLGLSIVENIMAQLGGHLVLLSPAEERANGFEARLVFGTAGSARPGEENLAAE
jgi:two-component system, OmpR family, sensor kinase